MAGGMSQRDRFLHPLHDDYFGVDELGFEEIVSLGAAISGEINFFNLNNEHNGSWHRLFIHDEATVLAMIAAFKPALLERRFQQCQDRFLIAEAALVVYDLALRLDDWLRYLTCIDGEVVRDIGSDLRASISERLASHLHWLFRLFDELTQRNRKIRLRSDNVALVQADFSVFSDAWGIGLSEGEACLLPHFHRRQPLDAKVPYRVQLGAVFNRLIAEGETVQRQAVNALPGALKSGTREPAAAMFIAFARLLASTRDGCNRFKRRHLDFYYRDCLGLRPREAVPERMRVVFPALEQGGVVLLPSRTRLDGGVDSQDKPILFESVDEITVSDASVKELRTVLLDRDELISPEREFGFVARILENRNVLQDDEKSYVPVFSASRKEDFSISRRESEVGMAIATDTLLLVGGRRRIAVSLIFDRSIEQKGTTEASFVQAISRCRTREEFIALAGRALQLYLFFSTGDRFDDVKQAVSSKVRSLFSDLPDAVAVIEKVFGRSRHAFFEKYLTSLFRVSVTEEGGWREIPIYRVASVLASGEDKYGIVISFDIGADDAPLIGRRTDDVHDGLPTDTPMVRLLLNPRTDFFGYSLLSNLNIERVDVSVSVSGVRDVVAANQNGALDAGSPFRPFGPMPEKGNYLVFGSGEAARKQLDNLSVSVEWGGLPSTTGGLRAHYKGYNQTFEEKEFIVDTAVLRNGEWHPKKGESRQRARLFDTKPGGGIADTTVIPVSGADQQRPVPVLEPDVPFAYQGAKSRDGFFKLTLSGPKWAFGHQAYPSLLTRVLQESAGRKRTAPLPSPPYTPIINQISLSYTASDTMVSVAEETRSEPQERGVYHIYPFGFMNLFSTKHAVDRRVVPTFHHDGNLYIGVQGTSLTGTLCLFFYLREDATLKAIPRKEDIFWHYLASNEWRPLTSRDIISDTTLGLLESGIVTLNVPRGIDRNSTIFPSDLYWFSVSADDHLGDFGNIYSVVAHGVEVERVHSTENGGPTSQETYNGETPLSVVPSKPALLDAVPIGGPFGGRKPENRERFLTRVAERLGHRMRATNAKDFEQMVLDRFSEVAIVKCFTTGDEGPALVDPGTVRVVIVPHIKHGALGENVMPRAGAALLAQVKHYLEARASDCVEVLVRNPSYEQILVKCVMTLAPGAPEGRTLSRINQALSAYISPWDEAGNRAKFGWQIALGHLLAYIRSIENVDYVTALSLLGVSRTGERFFTLEDTANIDREGTNAVLLPLLPWSIAVPFPEHFIDTVDNREPVPAVRSGINTLEIGKTFIIGDHQIDG